MYDINPVVKWAGGKRQLLDELKTYMPKKYKTYYEPFIGGGALFFSIQPKNAAINDSNSELSNLYRTIRTKKPFKMLISTLDSHEANHSEEYYYNLRNIDKNQVEYNKLTRYEKSARTLYMNKACFNGLYRVNSKGEFNVPFNGKEAVKTYDLDNLNAMHEYLFNNKIKICSKDYEKVVASAKKVILYILIHLMMFLKINNLLLLILKMILVKKNKKDYVKYLKDYLKEALK